MRYATDKLLRELPMVGLGTGLALTGVSGIAIGLLGVKKNFYYAGVIMAGSAWFAHVGSQIALGAIERVRGL